ncbi:MAG: HAMP domain-containing histidine kinase [Planctomycetes bacterium]|nr:HAMP domain-containing histidine kinase [Planctomycetota bacterium]
MSPKLTDSPELTFAARVAHQLKAPIAAVKMTLSMLLGDFAGPLTEKQRELLTRADLRCDQAIESIERMLTVAAAARRSGPTTDVTDLAAVARRAIVHYRQEASEAGVSLTYQISDAPVHVCGHEAGLHEAISALLHNALKYTSQQGHVRLRLTEPTAERTVRLSIADSGIGVGEEDRDRIFEPFFRAAAAVSSGRPGTGLGLALVKAMVDAAGGNVRVETSDLGGAEFIVELRAAYPPG